MASQSDLIPWKAGMSPYCWRTLCASFNVVGSLKRNCNFCNRLCTPDNWLIFSLDSCKVLLICSDEDVIEDIFEARRSISVSIFLKSFFICKYNGF
ncbi:unnamed protein product [Acanthoscelides obtectus]|uniref:Uncharacterized protein n=1 Tax=Acanthoscelides obtectus TaxID=200917 RepID=A0A9P0LB40_ACAOB|nr:unnamed protein product [Acanthoscelides obtectus]CAK1675188.1 hypothetical protein AOBTE_LOCUS30045 [Acanthoscelides obtectus]